MNKREFERRHRLYSTLESQGFSVAEIGRIYRRPLSAETKTRIILAVGVLAYLLVLITNLIDLF